MSGIHRFLTRRERNGRYGKHNKEESSHILSRPHLRAFFTSDHSLEDSSEQQKKIKYLEQRIAQHGITGLKEEHIRYALQSAHAQGDADKAFEILLLYEDSIEGIIKGYSPRTKLLGAENREGVTCYLDALLFAMFARLDCFEGILYKSFSDEPRRKLSMLLRLWVNLLRSGTLITTDVTKHIQDALAECGWEDAARLRQQDASEAFTFITEKLELPLLTLKMDIYHTGKEDMNDDHRFVNERLLEVAIPEPVNGKSVTLEDCLESYFNNRIEVKRYLERHNSVEATKSMESLSLSKGSSTHVETVELSSPTSSSSPTQLSPAVTPISTVTEMNLLDKSRHRRDSIVQQRFIPDSDSDNGPPSQRRGSYRKEVMMPAWQFFSLIPWYTVNTPSSDSQVASHFSSKRPILGMCLKRYSMLPNGKAVRLDTFVDIPTEIGLPHFIQDDNMEDNGPICGNFKLSLQALVCHRGNSVDSGHYIAIVRGTSAGAPPSSSHGLEQPNTGSSRYWMRFDDLAAERVTLIDIEQALKQESPYLLFYQILPIDEDAAAANLIPHPPSSEASDIQDFDLGEVGELSPRLQALRLDTPSIQRLDGRPSLEITSPVAPEPRSVPMTDIPDAQISTQNLQVHTGPTTSPKLLPGDDESRSSFTFTRRGSRATRSNPGSRAGSQASEKRISATFSRFTGRLSRDKIVSDGYSFEELGDELARNDLSIPSFENSGVINDEIREKSPRRAKNNEKQKERVRNKSKDRIGRKLDRECVIM